MQQPDVHTHVSRFKTGVGSVVRGLVYGLALSITAALIIIGLMFREQIQMIVFGQPVIKKAEVNLGATTLKKMYTYAEKDFLVIQEGSERKLLVIPADGLYVGVITCAAGIDYQSEPFEVLGRTADTIRMRIPEPKITGCFIRDPGKLKRTGWLDPRPELLSELQVAAQAEVRERAKASDLLEKAKEQALKEAKLDLLLLGFREVDVEFKTPTSLPVLTPRPSPAVTPRPR